MKEVKVNCVICKKRQRKAFDYGTYQYYRCQNCGLVSTYPIPSDKDISTHYAARYKKGNYKLLNDFSKDYLLNYTDFANIIEKNLKDTKSGSFKNLKVLDIGCFTGDFLKILEKRGAEVYGVELQKDAVMTARNNVKGKIIEADIMKYKFKKNFFDVISMQGLIEHVNDPDILLRRAHELLKKDGILMIQTPNSGSLLSKAMGKYWPPYSPVEHIHIFSKSGLVEHLEKMGFEIMTEKNHWKQLSPEYVYNMLNNFGREFKVMFFPIYSILPNRIKRKQFPFYIGEIIITAKKIK